MSEFEKTKRLIREGQTNIHDNFTSAMINLKKTNPKLSHKEVMELLKTEFDKFMDLHSVRLDQPRIKGTKFVDTIPVRPLPFGSRKRKD